MTPVALTIAGSDPSGSSGLQADLPTFAAFDVHAISVITVATAQDSLGVHAFHQLPTDLVTAQLDRLLDDLAPRATKTGLLRAVDVIELVAERSAGGRLGALIVDPVMVDSAGRPIVEPAAIEAYRELASDATLLTPNRWEAELLTGMTFPDDDPTAAVEPLRALGCDVVVMTGGRGSADAVTDLAITANEVIYLSSPRVGTQAIRGTGCTFSAAAAAGLARGASATEAVHGAHQFVNQQLSRTTALQLGAGRPGVPHGIDCAAR